MCQIRFFTALCAMLLQLCCGVSPLSASPSGNGSIKDQVFQFSEEDAEAISQFKTFLYCQPDLPDNASYGNTYMTKSDIKKNQDLFHQKLFYRRLIDIKNGKILPSISKSSHLRSYIL